MIKNGIKQTGRTLTAIFLELHLSGIKVSQSYLSLLQNGKAGPASDEVNRALAKVLGLDETELLVAAYQDKVPDDVLRELVRRASIAS